MVRRSHLQRNSTQKEWSELISEWVYLIGREFLGGWRRRKGIAQEWIN